jgi:hypothetical protein
LYRTAPPTTSPDHPRPDLEASLANSGSLLTSYEPPALRHLGTCSFYQDSPLCPQSPYSLCAPHRTGYLLGAHWPCRPHLSTATGARAISLAALSTPYPRIRPELAQVFPCSPHLLPSLSPPAGGQETIAATCQVPGRLELLCPSHQREIAVLRKEGNLSAPSANYPTCEGYPLRRSLASCRFGRASRPPSLSSSNSSSSRTSTNRPAGSRASCPKKAGCSWERIDFEPAATTYQGHSILPLPENPGAARAVKRPTTKFAALLAATSGWTRHHFCHYIPRSQLVRCPLPTLKLQLHAPRRARSMTRQSSVSKLPQNSVLRLKTVCPSSSCPAWYVHPHAFKSPKITLLLRLIVLNFFLAPLLCSASHDIRHIPFALREKSMLLWLHHWRYCFQTTLVSTLFPPNPQPE